MSDLLVLVGDLDGSPVNTCTIRFLTWLRDARPEVNVHIVSRFPGDLHREIGALGNLFVANEDRVRRVSGALQTARLHKASELVRSRELRWHLTHTGGDVYLADLGAAPLLGWLEPGRPVVAHLHAEDHQGPADLDGPTRELLRARVRRWVVGTHAAPAGLAAALGTAPTDTVRFRTPFHASELWTDTPLGPSVAEHRAAGRRWLLEHRSIPVDPPLIVSGGDLDWWATDNTFVQLCWEVARARPARPAQALWVAAETNERQLWPLRHDIRHAGLEHIVHVTGSWPPLLDVLASADVVVSTGLGPGLPALDALLPGLGVPLVRFDTSPEPPDDLDVTPITVPYLDLAAMRDAVVSLVDDPSARAAVGAFAPEGPALWDPEVGWPALLDLVRGR